MSSRRLQDVLEDQKVLRWRGVEDVDLSDIDMWHIDLSDPDLDFLDTDISSKHFVCLQDVLKTSWRHVLKMSSRQDVLKTCLEDQQMFAGLVLSNCREISQ